MFFIAYRCVKVLSFISLHGSNVLIIIKTKYYFFLIERNNRNLEPHMIEAEDPRSFATMKVKGKKTTPQLFAVEPGTKASLQGVLLLRI